MFIGHYSQEPQPGTNPCAQQLRTKWAKGSKAIQWTLFRNEKEQTTSACCNVGKPHTHHAKWKKSDPKYHILDNSIHTNFLGKTNLWRQKAEQWLPRARSGVTWLQTASREHLGGNENRLKLDCGDGCTTLHIYKKSLNCTLIISKYKEICIGLVRLP